MADTMSSRPRRSGLLRLSLVVAVLVAGGAFAIGHFDADSFKPRVEAAFEHATGRRLHLDGDLRFTLLPAPGVVVHDVSVDNLPGGSRPVAARARAVTATLNLFALLARRIEIQTLSVTDPDILLESVGGVPNWRFVPPPHGSGAAGPSAPHGRMDLDIGQIDAAGGHLAWRHVGRAGSGDIALDRVHAQQQGRSSVTFFVAARHRTTSFTISVASGPLGLLLARERQPFPFRATLTAGPGEDGDRIHADGTLVFAAGQPRFSGRVHAILPQLSDLNGIFPHARLPDATNLDIDAAIGEDAQSHWRVGALKATGLTADLGRFVPGLALHHFTLAASDGTAPLRVDLTAHLHQMGFSIDGVAGTPAFWDGGAGNGPLDVTGVSDGRTLALNGTIARDAAWNGRIQGRMALHLPTVDASGALDLTGSAKPMIRASLTQASVTANGERLPADRVDAQAAASTIIVQAFNAATPWLVWQENLTGAHRTTLTLHGHDLPAAALSELMTGNASIGGRVAVDATLHGLADGARLRLDTVSGPISATLTNGVLQAAALRSVLAGIGHAAHLPIRMAGEADVRCATGSGHLDNGVLTVAHVTAETPFAAIVGSGRIDLPSKTLHLQLSPTVHLGGAEIATEVSITGEMQAPTIALAAGGDGRVGIRVGASADLPDAACAGDVPDRRKPPKAADFLRALGLFH